MRISQKMGLNKSKFELDFYDYEIEKDNYAFLDPYYISKKEDKFLEKCNTYIETFFERFLVLLREDEDAALDLFSHLGEVNEICLGMSKGNPAGRGIGKENTLAIFDSIKSSHAFQNQTAKRLEDVRLFVPGIDKDKISDMVANIIKIPLIEYTQEQCRLWGLKLESRDIGYCWDKQNWTRGHKDILVIDNKEYLLFPKNLVSDGIRYSSTEFFRMYILEHFKKKHLETDSPLVKKTYDRKGRVKNARVFKKDVEADLKEKYVIDKEWLSRFAKENPDIYENFRKDTIQKILVREDVTTKEEYYDIIDRLITSLEEIPTGGDSAKAYHHLMSGILEFLFFPHIAHPKIEQEIHDGRKRIDITFDNIAENGFFFLLGTTYDVPCSLIMVECKNYKSDIKNPELDQMAGRFSARRGKFGIICCREIENEELFLERERDTLKDDRGWIIHLTDKEIIFLLELKRKGQDIDSFLIKKYQDLLL